jgi:hypothetical protein
VGKRAELDAVFFINFPKPYSEFEKTCRWLRLCGRENFGPEKVTKDTYICSKHFVGGHGPTEDHPEPIPATATSMEIRLLSKKPRKRPAQRVELEQTSGKVGKLVSSAASTSSSTTVATDNERTQAVSDLPVVIVSSTVAESDAVTSGQEGDTPGCSLTLENLPSPPHPSNPQAVSDPVSSTLAESESTTSQEGETLRHVQGVEEPDGEGLDYTVSTDHGYCIQRTPAKLFADAGDVEHCKMMLLLYPPPPPDTNVKLFLNSLDQSPLYSNNCISPRSTTCSIEGQTQINV